MKWMSLILIVPLISLAQTVDIKNANENTNDNESTTIEITKGKKSSSSTSLEVVEGAVPITGEPATMNGLARQNWQKACDEWKKEFREDNKENTVLSVNCGTPECSGPVGRKSCSSTAKFSIKTKVAN